MPSTIELLDRLEEISKEAFDELATKGDIHRLEAKIEQTKTELLKWIIGLFLAQTTFMTGLVLAIMKLFAK